MGAGELEDALQTFSALIKSHPEFTEAWNKRATVYFLLGRHHLNPNPSPNPNPNPKPNPNPNPNPNLNPNPNPNQDDQLPWLPADPSVGGRPAPHDAGRLLPLN